MGRFQASDAATRMFFKDAGVDRPVDPQFQAEACPPAPGFEVIPTQVPGDKFDGKDCSPYRNDNKLVNEYKEAKKSVIYIESFALEESTDRAAQKPSRLDILLGNVKPEARDANAKLVPVTGSGFFITADGRALTSYHVVKDAPDRTVVVKTADGKTYKAHVDALDPKRELALLSIERQADETFRPMTLRMNSDMQPGARLLALGFPQGAKRLHLSIGGKWVTPGPFDDFKDFVKDKLFIARDGSGFVPGGFRQKLTMADYAFDPTGRRSVTGGLLEGEDPNRKVLEADMKAEPGNSGGPVTDENFEVTGLLGLTSTKVSRIGATPVEDLWQFISEKRVFETVNAPRKEKDAGSPYPGTRRGGFDFLSPKRHGSVPPPSSLQNRVDGIAEDSSLRSRLRDRVKGR